MSNLQCGGSSTVEQQGTLPAVGGSNPTPPLQVPDLYLEFCSRTDPRYKEIRDRHYVANKGAHAQQIHFIVHYKGKIVGIISAGSAAYATAARDSFFGINTTNREKVLNGIIDNTVFRLEFHEPNLATRVIAIWQKVAAMLWEDLYGVSVYGFETFVVEEDYRKGTLYKADNWTNVGMTSGSTKNHDATGLTTSFGRSSVIPKIVYCKWRPGYSTPVESVYKSSWKSSTPEEKQRGKELGNKRKKLMGMGFYAKGNRVFQFERK